MSSMDNSKDTGADRLTIGSATIEKVDCKHMEHRLERKTNLVTLTPTSHSFHNTG
ncbi:hypothetical protein ACU8KH_05918 [Lachancea thermotolerans]